MEKNSQTSQARDIVKSHNRMNRLW